MRAKFNSGDLLAIYPANDTRERLYSIGNHSGNIQLVVKLHPNGLGSGFLNNLESRKYRSKQESSIIKLFIFLKKLQKWL